MGAAKMENELLSRARIPVIHRRVKSSREFA